MIWVFIILVFNTVIARPDYAMMSCDYWEVWVAESDRWVLHRWIKNGLVLGTKKKNDNIVPTRNSLQRTG